MSARPKVADDPTLAARFWSKVDRGDDCWEWTAHRNAWGYGTIGVGGRAGTDLVAHRVAYELVKGPIPEGLQVDHLCSNRGCVRPDHLEAVTKVENIRRGATARLTPAIVSDIRRRSGAGEAGRALAREFGIGRSTAQAVIAGHTWRGVA